MIFFIMFIALLLAQLSDCANQSTGVVLKLQFEKCFVCSKFAAEPQILNTQWYFWAGSYCAFKISTP